MHGLARGAIQTLQGGSFRAGFFSGFSSGMSVGTKGYGGFVGRRVMMGVVGGTASALGGGKFSNGAMSGAFTQMFNAENVVGMSADKLHEFMDAMDPGLDDNTFMFLPFGKLLDYGEALFGSKLFGVGSKLFGQKYVRGTEGILNVQGKSLKIGWSGTGEYGGGSYLRIGIGVSPINPNHARIHFKVPGTFVPDSVANPIREGIRRDMIR